MKKILGVILFMSMFFTIKAQDSRPEPIKFPPALIKYLPDSLQKNFDAFINDAIQNQLPNEYLWSFLPDSIQALLPDSIDKFVSKEENMPPRRLFTAEDLMSLKRISDINLSPNGEWIAFTLRTPRIKGNTFSSDIYVFNTQQEKYIQFTKHGKNDYSPVWSPDGKKIAFISDRNKTPQIYIKDFPDGDVKQLTKIETGVSNLHWSPDGKYISFTSDVKLEKTVHEKYTNYKKSKVRIYTDLPIRHWSEWTDEYYSHLFIIPVEGGNPIDLMEGEKYDTPLKPFGGAEQIAWSPNSKEIAYVCKKIPNFVKSTNSDIYIYNLETKKTRNVTSENKGFDLDPKFSPDGKWLAYISQEHDGFESDKRRLMIKDLSSGETIDLTKDFDYWVHEFVWMPNSKAIIFNAGHRGTVKIFKVELDNSEITTIADGWFNYSGLSIDSKGYYLAYSKESMTDPAEIYFKNLLSKEEKRITFYSDYIMNQVKKPRVEEKWVTAVDGKSIHCWVVYPPDFDSTKKYPLITYCQGGPQSMIGQRFHFRWNYMLMSSHGYVMILPNRRGVPGFGQDWNNAISKDWGGKPMQDIMAATDIMLKKPFIDPEGSCAAGASAGGYAVFWLAGHHNGRYKAFASHCGVFNLESMYGSTEELWFPDWEYGGPYWEGNNRENYEKNSPHRYVQNWDTPIFISTGEYDFRVPYTQSLEAFTAAKVKGLYAKLMIFPEETHFIAHPQEFIIWDSELFEFLDKYCKH